MKRKRERRFSHTQATRAFKGFSITRIRHLALYDGDHDPIIEIHLEHAYDRSQFIYRSAEPENLSEYGRALYEFMTSMDREEQIIEEWCYWSSKENNFVVAHREIKKGNEIILDNQLLGRSA